jgi:diacylglycerol kinase (ATP)
MKPEQDQNQSFSVRQRLKSFSHAFRGLALLLKVEHNAWIHTVATILVIAAGFFFHISTAEWIAVTIVIGLVFMAEGFNSAIEALCDHITPEYSHAIKRIKDLAAGAVLVAAITAAIVGLLVFVPKLLLIG